MRQLRSVPRLLAALLLASAAPLLAQLNPKHQDPGGTDLLDVYKGGGAKPEIITTFDNSGSMSAMYFDARYYPDVDQKWHNNRWTDHNSGGSTNGTKEINNFYGDDDRLWAVVKTSGSGATFAVTVDWVHGDFYNQTNSEVVMTGVLLRPDGTPVTNATGGTTAFGWVKLASHVRSTARDTKGTASLADDDIRTVDIPIPWGVFEPTVGAMESSNVPSLKIDAGMPKLMRIWDPVPSNPSAAQHYIVDKTYQNQTSPNYIVLSANSYSRQRIGLFNYTMDYIWWIFFGKDVRVNKYVDASGTLQSGNAKPYSGTNKGGFAVAGAADTTVNGTNLGSDGVQVWNNGIPGMTRLQAVKYACLSAYVEEQDNVFWCIRWFATCGTSQAEEGKSTFDSNNQNGAYGDRKLNRLLPPSSSSGPNTSIDQLQGVLVLNYTPLAYAMMNTLAQMANSNTGVAGSEFNANKTENPIPACRQSYVAIFTDGIANDRVNCSTGAAAGGSGDAYGTGAAAGNTTMAGSALGAIKPGGTHFNIWSLAAVAAHYPYLSPGTYPITSAPTDSGTANVKAPWAVTTRGAGAAKGSERRIRTFTVGVGLAGDITSAGGGKGAMYLAALYGNPKQPVFSKAAAVPPYDPDDANRNDRNKNPFFFEADSPDKLVKALRTILNEVKIASSTLSAPTTPLVGFSLGKQVYVGTFSSVDGPIWKGDLLMSGLKVTPTEVTFLGDDGLPTTTLNAANAVWSASTHLQSVGWKGRGKLYTSRPATPTTLVDFDEDVLTKTDVGNAAMSTADFKSLIRYIRGADNAAQTFAGTDDAAPNSERSDIMGDIIDSTPAVLEFPLAMAPGGLDPGTIASEKRFRVIFVGDNQGWFHAFGEVSGLDGSGKAVGAVKELWAYFPSEVLPHAFRYRDVSAGHRYIFDGSPVVYHDDKPAGTLQSGNGVVDGSDVVRIVVGLGKGGRGYYCFTLAGNDPTTPQIAWVRIPDEVAPVDTTLAENLVGWSTAKPALASVKVGSANVDAVFIGGGLSTLNGLEDPARLGGVLGAGVKLGRKVLALDTLTGATLKTWDTSTWSGAGSVYRGVLPYEFFPNSGQAQRVYFSDQGGNVFALGKPYDSGTFRGDTADIDSWKLRRVFQGITGTPISSMPAAFRIKDGFPVARTGSPLVRPAVVGLAFGQGDRNDPTDFDKINPAPADASARNRFIVLFDRQDSASVTHGASYSGKDFDTTGLQLTDLANLSSVASTADLRLDPNDPTYYLKEKLGYYLEFPSGISKGAAVPGFSPWYYPKTVSEARVLNGVLFFSMFVNGSGGACGGAGDTYTYRQCDIFAPVWNSASTAAADKQFTVNNDADSKCSGVTTVFSNIGGDIANVGTTGIIQAGQVKAASTAEEELAGTTGTISTQGAMGNPGTYGQRPRAWRVIR